MYSMLEKNCERVIASLVKTDVQEYDWLLQNRTKSYDPDFQKRYKNFWSMNMARLSGGFYETYFGMMNFPDTREVDIADLCERLWNASVQRNGRGTLQFSFATKLLHTLSPALPVYDSRIAWFYFFREPSPDLKRSVRIEKLKAFYRFLTLEYARIIKSGLLSKSIAGFREQFQPKYHTEEKIIDWLIWAFVGLANDGALIDGRISLA